MTGSMAVSSVATVPMARHTEGGTDEWRQVESRFIHALVAGEDPRQAVQGVLAHLALRWRGPVFLLLDGGRWIVCEGMGATVCRSILQRVSTRGWSMLQRLYQDSSWQDLDEAPCLSGLWAGLVESLGDPRLDSVWGEPVRDGEGRMIGLLAQCLPRSSWPDQDRRRLLAQAARSLGYLASVGSQNAEDRGVRDFVVSLAASAHALRTPLNALLGYGDLLLEALRGEAESSRVEDVRQMTRAGRRLAAMLQDVIDFAQCASGRLRIHPRSFEAEGFFQALITQVDGAGRNRWSLQWGAEREWHQDVALLQRLVELVLSEVDHRHSGEVFSLQVRDLTKTWVEVGLVVHGGLAEEALWREVAQGGVPLPQQEAAGGLALGLPLAWRLARALGGELISAEQGVTLRLPRCFAGEAGHGFA